MTNMKPPQEGRNTGTPSLRGIQGRSTAGLNGQAAKEEVSAMWRGGWMPENISRVPAGRSVFHLTSPLIGPSEAGRSFIMHCPRLHFQREQSLDARRPGNPRCAGKREARRSRYANGYGTAAATGRCALRLRLLRSSLTEAPSLHRHYPASSVLRSWDRARARRITGGGLPASPFRLRGGFTIPPWPRFPRPPYNAGRPDFPGPV
jgi:hypothetical protein